MKSKSNKLSVTRLRRLGLQGYDQCNIDLKEMAFGIRFTYRVSVLLLLISVPFVNTTMLLVMMLISCLGVILPNHPFDYIYNHFLAGIMNKPKLPRRKLQLKFASIMETLLTSIIIYLFYSQYLVLGYIIGGLLVTALSLASFMDLCMPSILFSKLFQIKKD